MESIDLLLLNLTGSPRTVAIIIITVTGSLKCWLFACWYFIHFTFAIVCPYLGLLADCMYGVCVFFLSMSLSSIVMAIVTLLFFLMVVVVTIRLLYLSLLDYSSVCLYTVIHRGGTRSRNQRDTKIRLLRPRCIPVPIDCWHRLVFREVCSSV